MIDDGTSPNFTSHNFPRPCDFILSSLSHSHSRSSLSLSLSFCLSHAIHTFLPLSFDCASSFAWLSDPVSLSHSLSPSKNFVSSVTRKNVIESAISISDWGVRSLLESDRNFKMPDKRFARSSISDKIKFPICERC